MLKPKHTKAPSGNACVHEITTEKELRDIVDNHAEVSLLFHWDKCPGCQELRKVKEDACQQNQLQYGKTPVALLGCEVGNPDCAKMWDEVRKAKGIDEKDYGVPVEILIPNKGSHKTPDHLLISASNEKKVELNNIIHQLGDFAKKVMQGGNASPQESGQRQSPPPSQQAPPPSQQAPPSSVGYAGRLYQGISNYVNEKPSRIYQMKANSNYHPIQQNLFCTAGYDCDHQTFQQKIHAYINAPSPSSMLWMR